MKKGIVALLLALALIVLISPGIVGRLAEKSMDENFDWAATESEEIVVTSRGFDRGWFSSEGQHRVEIKDGELRDFLRGYAETGVVPALIIDTRLDHGLIPLTSMARDKGSLRPGLGSAISTLGIESASGEVFSLPGTIYSTVGLTGELRSNYVLEPGSYELDGATANWGLVDIIVTTSPSSGAFDFRGSIETFAIDSVTDSVQMENIRFSGEQVPSPFGFRVGPLKASIQTIGSGALRRAMGPFELDSASSVDGDRVSARVALSIENTPFEDFGDANIDIEIRIENADGVAVGNIKRHLDSLDPAATANAIFTDIKKDAQRLLASGVEFHVDSFDVRLPQGQITTEAHVIVDKTDMNTFTWASLLLSVDARARLSIPAELVDLAVVADPQANAAIAMGFLKKNGNVYEMEASFKRGLLTVNGAPMPIPWM